MPYIYNSHRAWLEKPLNDLIEWVSWNMLLMGTRDDTAYHIVRKILQTFYGIDVNAEIPPSDEEKRHLVDKKLMLLIQTVQANKVLLEKRAGTLNYVVCRIINALYAKEQSRYSDYNNAMGVLSTIWKEVQALPELKYEFNGLMCCITSEYYARRVRPYEDEARDLNGEIFD